MSDDQLRALRAGVARVEWDEDRATTLRAQGWRVAEIGPLEDLNDFYDQAAGALGFPEHFGRNLDALWDCLTDPMPATTLIIEGWDDFVARTPRPAARLLSVLTERAELDRSPFAVLLLP